MAMMYYMVLCSFQDLLDPNRRDEIAAARATLKKNSMMLLTTSKVSIGWADTGEKWETGDWKIPVVRWEILGKKIGRWEKKLMRWEVRG